MMNKPIYIIDALRTIVGSPFKSLKPYTAVQLGASVMKAILDRGKFDKRDIGQVIIGNTVSAGLGQNMARQAAVLGGVGEDVNSFSVNHVCGSSMQAVLLGAQAIQCGQAQLVLCGGAESVTQAPFLLKRDHARDHIAKDDLIDSALFDGLYCSLSKKRMGDLVESLAVRHKITRKELDQVSLQSHHKAVAAQEEGLLLSQIVPLMNARGKQIVADDRPRKNVDLKSFSKLPPVFKKRGRLTAGNVSTPCDGAAVLCLASSAYVKQNQIKPLARISGQVSLMRPLKESFETDVMAIKALLKQAKLKMSDIDLFEVAEAFSAQCVLAQRQAKIPQRKLNIWGGDLAVGHPLGSAGARILVNLVHALKAESFKKGIACISFGGSGVVAVAIEAC
ncbi:thiolase family protein [Candidatus Omnitrophota bacterium]